MDRKREWGGEEGGNLRMGSERQKEERNREGKRDTKDGRYLGELNRLVK